MTEGVKGLVVRLETKSLEIGIEANEDASLIEILGSLEPPITKADEDKRVRRVLNMAYTSENVSNGFEGILGSGLTQAQDVIDGCEI